VETGASLPTWKRTTTGRVLSTACAPPVVTTHTSHDGWHS
jgi:hypothetical protein